MSKNGNRTVVKLKSSESAYIYTTTKSKRTRPGKLELRKYDPILRKHALFRENKIGERHGSANGPEIG
jgi:large subunit ribosomal protein L33